MKKAAVQEQVCVCTCECGRWWWCVGGIGLEHDDEQRRRLAPSPKEPPVAPRKWAVVREVLLVAGLAQRPWSPLFHGKGLGVPACPLAI